MEAGHVLIGALIFILLIVGANFVMFAVARGAARPNQKSLLGSLDSALHAATRKNEDPMAELHRRVQGLDGGKKDTRGDSD